MAVALQSKKLSRSQARPLFSSRASVMSNSEKSKKRSSVDLVNEPEDEGNKDSTAPRTGVTFVSSIRKDEPIVTRKELWSYYCEFLFFVSICPAEVDPKCTTTAIMYALAN